MTAPTRALTVSLYGKQAGTIVQSGGTMSFQYDQAYLRGAFATPLSLSMPLVEIEYKRKTIEAFLKGLLPDNQQVRQRWAQHFGLRNGDTFGLIAAIGQDAAGGAVFTDQLTTETGGRLEPISTRQIAARIRGLREDETDWLEQDEHWSLAGAQSKFTLRATEQGWATSYGTEPSTHIVKPGMFQLNAHALIEHVSMRACANLGMVVADTEFVRFGKESAIVIQRFDRRANSEKEIVRVHQEDMCQALSLVPDKKYEAHGGPGVARIVRLLHEYTTDDSAQRFVQAVIANYLLGAPDAHAKNYSILLARDSATLAPLYDVGSGLTHVRDSRLRYPKAAMSTGGERRFGEIAARNWTKFSHAIGYPEVEVRTWVKEYSDRMPDALSDAVRAVPTRTPDRSVLVDVLQPRVKELAKLTAQSLLVTSPPATTRRPADWASKQLAGIHATPAG